jgi:WD40 repeat protein
VSAIGEGHDNIKVFDARKGSILNEFASDKIHLPVFSPDDKTLLCCSLGEHVINVYDLENSIYRGTINISSGHKSRSPYNKTLSCNKKIIAVAGGSQLCLFDMKTLKPLANIHFGRDIYNIKISQYDITFNTSNSFRKLLIEPWSDRVHTYSSQSFKKLIFCLMCVKHRQQLSSELSSGKQDVFPKLSMQLWLDIFNILSIGVTFKEQ